MARFLRLATAFGLGSLLWVPACSDARPIAPLRDGLPECEYMGGLCHEPGDVFGGRYQECHDIGHRGDGTECLKVYDECVALCEAAVIPGEGGAGGAGGASSAEAGVGGVAGHD